MKRVGGVHGSPVDLAARGGSRSLSQELDARCTIRRAAGSPSYREHGATIRLDASRLGASAAALERAHRVLSGDGVAVVAGQQPALLGGPLYTLYKCLGAVSLARHLEETLGVPALAVFWSVGDDSDFGEISSTWIPTSSGRPRKLRDEDTPGTATMVGALSAERHLRAFDEAGTELRVLPGSEAVEAWVRASLEVSTSFGEFQNALVYRVLESDRLLCLDGADPHWLDPAVAWLRDAGTRWPLVDALTRGAVRAREHGMEPAFTPDQGEQPLFALHDERRETARGDEARLAPNVILRPLLQDWLLPNVATICGPSEIRYRLQLTPVYETGGVPEPLRLPRWQSVLLPAELGEDDTETVDYGALLADPGGWIESRAARFLPRELRDGVEAARRDVASTLDALGPRLQEFDPSLGQLLESTAQKTDFQMGRLLEGVEGKARHHAAQRIPGLAGLKEFLQPREKPQERVLSLLTPFLLEGAGVGHELQRFADEACHELFENGNDGRRAVTSWCRMERAGRQG